MTDERIVEVIARWLRSRDGRDFGSLDAFKPAAELALAALRGAGFDVYRPDDCKAIRVMQSSYAKDIAYVDPFRMDADPGTYRLVPVGGDS